MSLIYSNIPELEGTNTEIALANLSQLEVDLERLFEKRIAHLCELSRAIISDGGDEDLVKSIILSIRSDGDVNSENISSDNMKDICMIFSKISLIERLIVFKEVFGEMPIEKQDISDVLIPTVEAHKRIAYVKNSYNDTVFDHFSDFINDAKAFYLDNTTDVCESVSNGKCQYCILPIETMRDGKLISFYEAIINYNLKIYAEYDLSGTDGEEYTRYALLGNNAIQVNRIKDNTGFLEISYSDDNNSLCDMLDAAEYCGLRLESIDTLIIGKSDNRRFSAVFLTVGADIDAFMTYLAMDYPDVLVIGLYQRIKQ